MKYYSLIYYSGLNIAGIMDDDVDKYVKQKFSKYLNLKAQMMTVMPSEKLLWGGISWV